MEGGRPAFETLAFLDYELMPAARRLLRGGQPVAVGGRAFDLLVVLASHAGEVVAKRTLMQGVWPDTVVEDINLRAQVKNLRRLLGGGAACPHLVNLAGQGYCLTAPVRRLASAPVADDTIGSA